MAVTPHHIDYSGTCTLEMQDFEKAKDKIFMGPERKSMVMPEAERRNTAYHEAGHALVARLMPKTDPVHKVTIIPRGNFGGATMALPEKDRNSLSRKWCIATMKTAFGGRIAEEIFCGDVNTGAMGDIRQATGLARFRTTPAIACLCCHVPIPLPTMPQKHHSH